MVHCIGGIMSFSFLQVSWFEKRKELKQIRERVFVCEYHIPRHIEFDNHDRDCQHLLVIDEQGKSVATARVSKSGIISRVAVLAPYRTNEFYRQMFQQIAEYIEALGAREVSFNCKLTEKEKFTECGYLPCGHVFMEAGIARQKLTCPLSNFDPEPFTLVH